MKSVLLDQWHKNGENGGMIHWKMEWRDGIASLNKEESKYTEYHSLPEARDRDE